jgi:hypothetical protein
MKNALPEPSAVNFNLLRKKNNMLAKPPEHVKMNVRKFLSYPACLDMLSSLSSMDCNEVTFMLV